MRVIPCALILLIFERDSFVKLCSNKHTPGLQIGNVQYFFNGFLSKFGIKAEKQKLDSKKQNK